MTQQIAVIDLTMDDDNEDTGLSTSAEQSITPIIKQEPHEEDRDEPQNTDSHDLPDLPESTFDLAEDETQELTAEFENNLVNMLDAYHANSHKERAQSYDDGVDEAREAYEAKQTEIVTMESQGHEVANDMIELKRLEHAFIQAQKNREKVQAHERREKEKNSMFFAEEEVSDDDGSGIVRAPTRQEVTGNTAGYEEIELSNDDGSPPPHRVKSRAKRTQVTKKERKTPVTRGKAKVTKKPQPARRGGRRANVSMLNVGSLARNDIVADALRNQGQRAQPGFQGVRRRADALNALIASIPKEHQDTAYGMKTKLNNACKSFNWKGFGSMRPDGASGWRLKGMDSSLKHFQLLSASWGVDRERGEVTPFGGILADTMGYGKTVQMITIMVENQPKENAKYRTTLIVVPSSIVTQWMEELSKHISRDIMEDVFVYRSGSRLLSVDPCKQLGKYQVVITTYHEVMRNFPKCDPPIHLVTERAKDEWWDKYYKENCGPLLRMPFYRVVLDEAQTIKNHESRTSKACLHLTSKRKWVLTGTPLANCMEEIYPYFNFLGVEGAGTYAQFKHNYAKRNDVTMQRLDAMLRTVMVRRTGADRLFGLPLTSLPSLDYQTISVGFNAVEKAIYSVVRQRFINRINDWTHSGRINQLSRSIFVMLLRLRQMCAHVLMVTTTIRDLLEAEDVEKLWKVAERASRHADGNAPTKTAKVLKRILIEARSEKQETRSTPGAGATTTSSDTIDLTIDDSAFDFRGLFYRLQQDGAWDKIRTRSTCNACNEVPDGDRGKLAVPCGHLYCQDCLNLLLESAVEHDTEAECMACHNPISGSADMSAMEQIEAQAGYRTRAESSPLGSIKPKKGSKAKEEAELKWLTIPKCEELSSKIQAITGQMEKWINNDSEAKIVVFTLFIPIVQLLGKICRKKGWNYHEYTGKISVDIRNRNLKDWKDPARDNKVLLMSLRAGGLGLNLVEANHVIICDPWWNEPAEDQAFSRVYRIGQTKDCVVRRFVIADAVDTQLMLHLQKLKAQECDRVIDGRPNSELTIPDLLKLFGPTRRDPETGELLIEEGEDDDGTNEFVTGDDHVVVDDSDVEEIMPAPSRPREA